MSKRYALSYSIAGIICVAAGYAATHMFGHQIAPPPHHVMQSLVRLALDGDLLRELSATVARTCGGLLIANVCGGVLGFCAGASPFLLRVTAPLVAGLQACPHIVWISLALVWAGTGSAVPMAAVVAATVSPLFVGVAQGVLSADKRALVMSRLYRVPKSRQILKLLLPGVFPYWAAAFSHTLAAGWKVTAMAEFFGSTEGVGSRIFWAYRRMEMSDLLAWTIAIVLLGICIEYALAMPLRSAAGQLHMKGSRQEDAFVAT